MFLFNIVMDKLTKEIQDQVRWCMLSEDDIVLIDETRDGLNSRLEVWRHTLESWEFKLSWLKAEYLKCGFNGEEVTIGEVAMPNATNFKYLGLIIEGRGYIHEDINHRIRVGSQKWRNASGIFRNKEIPMELKRKVYQVEVRLALLYGSKCRSTKKA